MNSQKIIKGKLFLAVLVTMLCGMVAGGCSDDKDELVVKGEEGATLALCIVEVYDDTQE